MICNTGSHSWSNTKRLMNPNKVIMGKMKGDRHLEIIQFFAKGIS